MLLQSIQKQVKGITVYMCVIMFSGNYPGGKLIDLAIENKYENLQSSQLSTSNKI